MAIVSLIRQLPVAAPTHELHSRLERFHSRSIVSNVVRPFQVCTSFEMGKILLHLTGALENSVSTYGTIRGGLKQCSICHSYSMMHQHYPITSAKRFKTSFGLSWAWETGEKSQSDYIFLHW